MNTRVDFENTSIAFADKSDAELIRTKWLFATMNYPMVSSVGIFLMRFLLKIRFPIVWTVKRTIFAQFCGGISLTDSMDTVNKLARSNIKTILDFSVEGEKTEEGFESNKKEILDSLEIAKNSPSIPIGVFKPTALCSFELLEKKQADKPFSRVEIERFSAFESRVHQVCEKASKLEKSLFVDAEETWIQDVVDELVNRMMRKFNLKCVIIFNTYQMYRVDSLRRLKNDIKRAKDEGFKLGAKLVRGAYMEKERNRADLMEYSDPIQPNKIATDQDFDEAIRCCIEDLDCVAICAGTHNEISSQRIVELMIKQNLAKSDPRIYFAQLLGMSDNISYSLAREGYNVAKYVPYGPVRKVLPYLMRRAEENTAVSGRMSREYMLIKKEIARRRSHRK